MLGKNKIKNLKLRSFSISTHTYMEKGEKQTEPDTENNTDNTNLQHTHIQNSILYLFLIFFIISVHKRYLQTRYVL